MPPIRRMAELLEDEGFEVGKDTVRKDYRRLGIERSQGSQTPRLAALF